MRTGIITCTLLKFSKELKLARRYTFSIVSSATSTAHFDDPLNEAERLTIFAMLEGTGTFASAPRSGVGKLWKVTLLSRAMSQSQKDIRFAFIISILLPVKGLRIVCRRWVFRD